MRTNSLEAQPSAELAWLHSWYVRQCDGLWEHEAGMRFRHVAAQGRRDAGLELIVELVGTRTWLLGRLRGDFGPPRTLSVVSFDGAWLSCSLTSERFVGAANGDRLEEIVAVFRGWLRLNEELCARAEHLPRLV